jgi:calcium-dependent protein kinase
MADEANWRAAFDAFDADNSGTISAKELAKCLCKCGFSDADACSAAVDIMKEADKNEDGTITWDEFKSALAKK